jgi:hypothetical protein
MQEMPSFVVQSAWAPYSVAVWKLFPSLLTDLSLVEVETAWTHKGANGQMEEKPLSSVILLQCMPIP